MPCPGSVTVQASGLFSEHILRHLLVQSELGHQLPEHAVLFLQNLGPPDLGHTHALELLFPPSKGTLLTVGSLMPILRQIIDADLASFASRRPKDTCSGPYRNFFVERSFYSISSNYPTKLAFRLVQISGADQ